MKVAKFTQTVIPKRMFDSNCCVCTFPAYPVTANGCLAAPAATSVALRLQQAPRLQQALLTDR